MPVSKHRKKGQAKATKRPGRGRKEPAWAVQQRQIEDAAFRMLEADALDEHDLDVMELMLEMLLEEVLAFDVSGENLVPRIGSREAVLQAFVEEIDADEARARELAGVALDRFGACGFVRFDEDQVILQVPVPKPAA